jgi:predicted transcriptional regulator
VEELTIIFLKFMNEEGRFSPESAAGQGSKKKRAKFDEIFEFFGGPGDQEGRELKEYGPGTFSELIDILANTYEKGYDQDGKEWDQDMLRELEQYFKEKENAVKEALSSQRDTLEILFPSDYPKKGLHEWQIEEEQKDLLGRAAMLDLAQRTLGNLSKENLPWITGIKRDLGEAVEQRTEVAAKMPNSWVHGRAAHEATKKYGPDIAPWSAIQPGARTGAFDEKGADRKKIIWEWQCSNLHPEDEAFLQEKVREDGEWRETYRKERAEWISRTHYLYLGDFRLSLDSERVEMRFSLPHLGPEAKLEVKSTEKGIKLCWPGKPEVSVPVKRGVKKQSLRVEVGDDITGALEIPIEFGVLSPRQEAKKAFSTAREIARGRGEDRAVPVASAIAHRLAEGEWLANIKKASELFASGEELDEDEMDNIIAWVRDALGTRIALERASKMLRSEELKNALEKSDKALESYGEAVLFTDRKTYEELIGEDMSVKSEEFNKKAWWGSRAALDEAFPDDVLDEALRILGEEERKKKGKNK